MIDYTYLTDFCLSSESKYTNWISKCIRNAGGALGNISYVFADDDLVWDLNKRFLQHDSYTDILTFEDCETEGLNGEIVISVERIRENAKQYNASFEEELKRVMAHGVLHLLGFKDGTAQEKEMMRKAEEEWIKKFHVEH